MSKKPAFIPNFDRATLMALAAVLLIPMVYFLPALEGKKVAGHDTVSAKAMSKAVKQERDREGSLPYWSGTMFGGMPTYAFHGGEREGNFIGQFYMGVQKIIPGFMFAVLLGAVAGFFLLRHFRVPHALAVAGSLAYVFMNYHLVIIGAGHITKLINLVLVPGVFLGIVKAYDGKYLRGTVVSALFLALMFNVQHIQMTYFMLFVVGFYVIYRAVEAIREKAYTPFLLASGALLFGAIVALGTSASTFMPLQEYTQLSYRGPSELSTSTDVLRGAAQKADKDVKEAGLDTSYAYQWSNNRPELFTLLVPNFYGGKPAMPYSPDHAIYQEMPGQANQLVQMTGGRWQSNFGAAGNQAGPFYVGAIVLFLFVVGLVLVPSGSKYALLYAVILGLMLSLGRNSYSMLEAGIALMLPLVFLLTYKRLEHKVKPPVYGLALFLVGFVLINLIGANPGTSYKITDFFFFNLPLYNRFRVPGSALVIVSMALPWLAFLGARELLNPDREVGRKMLALYVGAGFVGGIALLIAALPSVFHSSFLMPQELQQMAQNPQLSGYFNAIATERESLVRTDAVRSLVLIVLAGGLFWGYLTQRIKQVKVVTIGIAALVAFDMIGVAWRYLTHEQFEAPTNIESQLVGRPTDQMIAQEYNQKTTFRVLPLGRNPFNEAMTAANVRSIGGYSAAKIKRYQQLADIHILNPKNKKRYYGINQEGGMTPYDQSPQVLNMLNMKYLIVNAQYAKQLRLPQYQLVQTAGGEAIFLNKNNLGPAWMVRNVTVAESPDSALMKLHDINTAKTAIVEAQEKDKLKAFSTDSIGPNESVALTFYSNDEIKYKYNSDHNRFVVFSEIYYPLGWTATIDGQAADILQTNFVLRGMVVPKGEHEIVFKFEPSSIETGGTISLICSLLLLAGIGGVIFLRFREVKRVEQNGDEVITDTSSDEDQV